MAGKFNLAEHILSAQPPSPRDIETVTAEIIRLKQDAGNAILGIGQRLIEAKEMLSHGEWLPWLEDRVEFTERAAQRFMRLAREYSNPTALSDLGATKALALLALPPEERESFIEESHIVNGEEKTVIDMTSRELETVIRERDEALKAAEQAKADKKAADEVREKMSVDMALANERIEGLNSEVEAQSAKAKEAQDAAARLEQELEELRSRPVEVDTAAVETARKEAEAAMQNKLDRATKARDEALQKRYDLEEALTKAKDAQKAAEDAKVKAQQELEQVKAEARSIREQAERAEKKAAIAANEDMVLFRTLFDQIQEQVNKLGGVLMKTRNKDPEAAGSLQKALLALADKIKGVAEG